MVRTELTLDDLEQMPDDAVHRELIDGELIELPPQESKNSDATAYIYDSLSPFVRSRRLGRAYVEAGYKVTADKRTWVQPDVSFVSSDYLARGGKQRFFEGAPDLAVEVISPPNARSIFSPNATCCSRTGVRRSGLFVPRHAPSKSGPPRTKWIAN